MFVNKREKITEFKKARIGRKDYEILSYCKGKKVLDVGSVGQELSYSDPKWLHNRIKNVASEVVGVDIDRSGINKLNELGFTVKHIDELEEGLLYDVIVMGDVIEHIGDIASFLAFYKKFLSSEGRMVITTPNPFSFRQVLHTLLYSRPSINGEHTCNLDPITMLELVSRGNFGIVDFCWLKEQKKIKGVKNHIINAIASFFIWLRKFYSQNFMIVLTHKSGE